MMPTGSDHDSELNFKFNLKFTASLSGKCHWHWHCQWHWQLSASATGSAKKDSRQEAMKLRRIGCLPSGACLPIGSPRTPTPPIGRQTFQWAQVLPLGLPLGYLSLGGVYPPLSQAKPGALTIPTPPDSEFKCSSDGGTVPILSS